MKKLRLVPVAGHEPVDPTGGAALPVPLAEVVTLASRHRPAIARSELEAVAA
jgi:hypothetical protein